MENNFTKSLPEAIPYDGHEEGIPALIIADALDNPVKKNQKKIVIPIVIAISLLAVTGILYIVFTNYSAGMAEKKALEQKLFQDSIAKAQANEMERIKDSLSSVYREQSEQSSESKEENTSDLQEIKIGSQTWSQNLNVDKFRNGDAITEAKTNAEWEKAGIEGKAAWCYYQNKEENGKIYGKLYNSYAILDPRGLAPAGWHIPNDDEWEKLGRFIGDNDTTIHYKTNYIRADKLKSKSFWKKPGTDLVGFNGLPSGVRYSNGNFDDLGRTAVWWSNNKSYTTSYLGGNQNIFCFGSFYREGDDGDKDGLSVRCLKD